jgi:HEAT repeat protein
MNCLTGLPSNRISDRIDSGVRMTLTKDAVYRAQSRADISELLNVAQHGWRQELRCAAVSSLGALKDSVAIPTLMAICATASDPEPLLAAAALDQIAPPREIVAEVVRRRGVVQAGRQSVSVLGWAVKYVGQSATSPEREELLRQLYFIDGYRVPKSAIIDSLMRIGSNDSKRVLLSLLNQESDDAFKPLIIDGLAAAHEQALIPLLLRIINDRSSNSESKRLANTTIGELPVSAARALAELGATEAIPSLIDLLLDICPVNMREIACGTEMNGTQEVTSYSVEYALSGHYLAVRCALAKLREERPLAWLKEWERHLKFKSQ